MPFRQYLSGEQFDAETTRIMGIAFEVARIARAGDRGAPADELIAKSIIELAQASERDADRLVNTPWRKSATQTDVRVSCSSPPPTAVGRCSSLVL
jgi:hypothetical protein